ncbi:hypothetical protein D3C71_1672870 [compost metagenome]
MIGWIVVPSPATTLNDSESWAPAGRFCTTARLLFSVYVQLPLASIENVPYLPTTLVCAATPLWPTSASATVNLPVEVSVKSSVTVPVFWPVITGASLVPVIVTVTGRVALPPWPSSTVTLMVSVTCWPSFRP